MKKQHKVPGFYSEYPSYLCRSMNLLRIKKITFTAIIFHFCFLSEFFAQGSPVISEINDLHKKAASMYHPDSIIFYSGKALQLSREAGNSEKQIESLYLLAKACNSKADYRAAENFLNNGIELADSINSADLKGICILEKGKTKQLMEIYDKALSLFYEAVGIFAKTGNTEFIVRTNVYIAEYYRHLGNFSDAETYIHNAMTVASGNPLDKQLQILLYNRAAAIKSEIGQSDSSLYYSDKALSICRETGNLHYEAISLNEIGFIMENRGNFDKAEEHYKRAEKIWKEGGYARYWVNAVQNLARTLSKAGKYDQSITHFLKLSEVAESHKWLTVLVPAYESLSENYYQTGNFKASADFSRKHTAFLSELNKNEQMKASKEIKAKYEAEKNLSLLEEKEREIENANLRILAKKQEVMKLLFGSALLILIIALLIFVTRQRSRVNAELKKKNEQIEETNRQLRASLEKSQTLMSEVHHRVKNNLQIISSMFRLQANSLEDGDFKNRLVESNNRILLMGSLHERLYRQNKTEKLNSREMVKEITDNVFQTFSSQAASIQFTSDISDISINMDKAVSMGIIINELVTNSIKHAFPNNQQDNQILVSMMTKNKKNFLLVCDNGIGIPADVFSGNGSFGMSLVNIMVEQVHGSMKLLEGKGTNILIEF